jgi:hypothetical protein
VEIVETSPDDHLASIDDSEVRVAMVTLDAAIVAAMPARRRVLWQGVFWGGTEQSIIGYGVMRQVRPKGEEVEWFLVGLARQQRHYSVYVNAVDDGDYLGRQYADRLGKVKLGAASIGFRSVDDLDLDGFAAMLHRADEITPGDPSDM